MRAIMVWTVVAGLCVPALTGCRDEREQEPERMEEREQSALTYGGEQIGETMRGAERAEAPVSVTPAGAEEDRPWLSDLRYQIEQEHAQIRAEMTEQQEEIQTQMAGEHDLIQERLDDLEDKVEQSAMTVEVRPAGRPVQAEAERRDWQAWREQRREEMMERYETLRREVLGLQESAEATGEPLSDETRQAIEQTRLRLDAFREAIRDIRATARDAWDELREPLRAAEIDAADALEELREQVREERRRQAEQAAPMEGQPIEEEPTEEQPAEESPEGWSPEEDLPLPLEPIEAP
ncbi:MAG: hypothetical protein ACQEXJ_24590 [Myxococcota bacterium]